MINKVNDLQVAVTSIEKEVAGLQLSLAKKGEFFLCYSGFLTAVKENDTPDSMVEYSLYLSQLDRKYVSDMSYYSNPLKAHVEGARAVKNQAVRYEIWISKFHGCGINGKSFGINAGLASEAFNLNKIIYPFDITVWKGNDIVGCFLSSLLPSSPIETWQEVNEGFFCLSCLGFHSGSSSVGCPLCGSDDITSHGEKVFCSSAYYRGVSEFSLSPVLPAVENILEDLPVLDLQLFAGTFKASAPSHILYTVSSEEYIIRSYFNGHGPDYVRHAGKNQQFEYVAGPFWSKQSARDILNLAEYFIAEGREDFLCDGFSAVPLSIPSGGLFRVWLSCLRRDSMMSKLNKVLSHKGYKLFKDWSNFGTTDQKMIYWLKLKR